MRMRLLLFILAIGYSLGGFAQDVIMATSEDLKEFDQMLSKKMPPPNQVPPQGAQNAPPNPNQQKKQKKNFRADFNRQGGDRPMPGNRKNLGPDSQNPPPPNGLPPPPPP